MKKALRGIIICLVCALMLALPAKGAGADSALPEQRDAPFSEKREQEFVSPEMIRELARVHYARARGYYRRGEYSKAKAEFEEVLKLEPKHQGAQWYLKCAEGELDKYEKTFSGRLEKLKERKKAENLNNALDSIEKRSPEGQLRVERAGRRELEKEEAKLLKQVEKYQAEAEKVKKGKSIAARELGQLQKEKNDLEIEIKKYKQSLKKQERLIEQAQRESEQRASMRLKEVEAEKQQLAVQLDKLRQDQQAQLKDKIKKYEQSLRDKFGQEIANLNKKIESYEAAAKQYEAKAKQLEKTTQQLGQVQVEKADLQAKLEELRQEQQAQLKQEQQAQLKDELKKYEKALEDKLAQKEAQSDKRIDIYESKLAQLEEERQELEKIGEDTYKQTLELKKDYEEKANLQAKLEELRQEQQVQLEDELQKYEKTLEDKLTQKLTQFNDKIEQYEVKIKTLQQLLRSSQEQLSSVQDKLKEEPAPEKESAPLEDEQRLTKQQPTLQVQEKVEKQERLRLKREAEAKRQEEARLKKEEARLKKEQERKAKEERLAKLKAEKEAKERARQEEIAYQEAKKKIKQQQLQKKIGLHYTQGKKHFANKDYIASRKEFKDILIIDPKNQYALNALEKVNATEAREEKEYQRSKQEEEEAKRKKRQEEAQLKQEQERKAREEQLAKLKAEEEEKLRLKREAEPKQREQKHLEQERKVREKALERAQVELAKQARIKARQEELARIKAEKEEKLARIQAEKEEKLRLKREAEAKPQEEVRLEKERLHQLRLQNEAKKTALEEGELKLKAEKLRLEKEEELPEEVQGSASNKELRLHLAQGKIYFYREQYEQAIEEFKQTLLLDPEYPSVGEYIRKCQKGIEEQKHQQLQTKEKKTEQLQKTAELIKEEKQKGKQEKIKEFYKKGKMYFRRGLYSEAIACFEKVIELEGNPRIHYTPQAQEYIERVKTEMEEEKKEAAQGIAEEEAERKKDEEMQTLKAKERAQEEARRREEETIRRHYQLGKKYYGQRNYPMAIAEFNKIKEINPQHSYVSYAERYIEKCQQKIIQREEAELRAGMKKETKDLLKGKEIEIKKEEGLGENLLAQARWYYERGDYEQTIKICRAILELEPLNKKARSLLYKAELKQIKREQKQGSKEVEIDEKGMLATVAQTQVLSEEKKLPVKEREIIPIVKVPVIREKLKNPVTIDFRDVDLSYVLNFLADSTGVNIIPASGVSLEGKKVSIRMKDMPAENALKYILKNQGLSYRIEEDAVWVASPAEMDKEEVETRVYFLNRGSGMFTEFERAVGTGTGLGGASAISKITTIKDILEEAVDWPKNSKLVLDERSGALIISNTPANLQIIEDILYNLDITPIQVLIEARFVELQVTDVEQLGIEWKLAAPLGDKRRDGLDYTQWGTGTGWDFTAFTRATEGLNLTYSGVLTKPQFQSVLHALSETKSAKTLSSPRVTTLNNQMATIKVVDEWIYPTRYEFQVVQSDINGDGDFDDAGETIYSNVPVDFVTKDIGILLHATPNVGADGKTITLALVPEVSEGTAGYFSYSGSVSLPKFSSRTLSTSVVINNGDTVALGGLVKETATKTMTKVPILGDIPIIGNLFRKKNDSIVRTNLLIFVTATIISPSGEMIETVSQP